MYEHTEYKGDTYRRHKESDNATGKYFHRQVERDGKKTIEMLHRRVWREHNGEIPDGYVIHHKDGDELNNSIENLECITPAEHVSRHPEVGGFYSDEQEANFRDALREFFKTEEGRELSRKRAKEAWDNGKYEAKTKECEQCGETFEYYSTARFCSNACKSKHRRDTGKDDIEKECVICGTKFTTNKYDDGKTCSRKCTGALISWENRTKDND